MTHDDLFTRARELFEEALEQTEVDRLEFVRARSRGDDALEREVLSLLHAGERAGEFLSGSAIASVGGEDAWLGKTIGHYRIEGVIAGGGMGVVFRARQEHPQREVALKLIRGDAISRRALKRFELEAELLGRLDHPGIARIYDAGTTDAATGRQPYFVMELIDGLTLTEYARRRRLGTRECVELMIRICDGVNHAHQQGIVHRDLKPANILVREDGQPKILDFGIARNLDSDFRVTSLRTNVGQVVGTLPYMSPEQVRGKQDELDTRSDVYALGVLTYELLTGRLPQAVEGMTLVEAARVIEEDEPSSLGTSEQRFESDLETIVRKCLEKDKTRRYGSPGELAADLKRYLDSEPILARPPSALYQMRKFARRNRGIVATGAAGLAVLLLGLVVSVTGWSRAERARAQAEVEAEKANVLSEFMVSLLESPSPDEDGSEVRVLDILARADSMIAERLRGQPEVAASAHLSLGHTYRGLGLYPDAERQYRASLAVSDSYLPPNSALLYPALESLGDLFIDQGKLDAADSIATRIVVVEPNLPDDGPEVVDALYYRASLAEARGNLDQAIPIMESARVQAQSALGDTAEMTMVVEGALGNLLWQVDRVDGAIPLMEAAANKFALRYGEDHPGHLGMRHNLAYAYKAQGDDERALEAFTSILDDKVRVLGEFHYSTGNGYFSLASQLRHMGRADESVFPYLKAIAIADSLLGEEDIRTHRFRTGLGLAYSDLGQFDDAEPILLREYDEMARRYGADHPQTLLVAEGLAELFGRAGKSAEEQRFRSLAQAK